MKKLFLTSSLSLFALFVALPALAQDLGTGQGSILQKAGGEAGFSADTTETTFAEILGTVVQTALSFVGIIFLSLMVYAGYLWMTARGEQDQIEKAKKVITASIIGLIITVGAYSITAFVILRILNRATSALPFFIG